MVLRKQFIAGLLLAVLAPSAALAISIPHPFAKKKPKDTGPVRKLTPVQIALIDKASAREKDVIKVVKERAPLVETYIQNMKTDKELLQVPESDQHFLGRVQFSKVIGDDPYATNKTKGSSGKLGFFKNSLSYITGLSKALKLQFREAGFVQMLLMDSRSFDRTSYNFTWVRNEFLGAVPTMIFDVTPVKSEAKGGHYFSGRVWIESKNGNVVRFNGSFGGSQATIKEYYHFDSWRTNIQDNLWLPTSVYVEESDPKSTESTVKFKSINHIWGYALVVPSKEAEATSVEVVGATDASTGQDAQDVSPLGAQRAWVQQAEDNVVDRLYKAGLLDAPSEFDKTLEALAGNILAYNNIAVSRPIRVRTMMTEPLESLAVGNTVILSKGLIDTTAVVTQDGAQQMGNLNAILAFQVAHIVTGHRLDTKYAFNDRLLFPDTSAFVRIPMHHTDADNLEAAKKTLELLSPKELVDSQQYFGLYLEMLQKRVKALQTLNQPMLGDGLVKSDKDETFWLAALLPKGGKLDMNDLKQQAAVPLSSFLKFDPWTDQVVVKHVAYEPLLSSRDKMPFEITPIYLKLDYYKGPVVPPAPDPNAAPATTTPATGTAAPATGTAAPATGTPAPADTTAAPAGTTTAPANPPADTTTQPPATTAPAPTTGTSNPPAN